MNCNAFHLFILLTVNQMLSCHSLKCYNCYSLNIKPDENTTDVVNYRESAKGICDTSNKQKIISCEENEKCGLAEMDESVADKSIMYKILDCVDPDFCERIEKLHESDPIRMLHCRTCDSNYCNFSPRNEISHFVLSLTFSFIFVD